MRPVKKILVVTLSNLGDVVLTLPVFSSLSDAYPDAEIHAVTSARSTAVLEGHPTIRRVRVYDRRMPFREKWALLRVIRREHYDLIVDLRHSVFGFFGGARRRNAYLHFGPRPRHKALQHLSALRGLCAVSERSFFQREGLPEPFTSEELKKLSDGRRIVVAAPGSKSDIKKWPAGHYAKVLERLSLEENCHIVLVGDAADRSDSVSVRSGLRVDCIDLTGRTDLRGLISVLSRASLLLTNDSAPLHIAEALTVPVLAFFGPTDPERYGPRRAGSVALDKKIFCAPCELPQCRFRHECMKELSSDEAYRQAVLVLNDRVVTPGLRILVIRLDRIGDVILSLPAVSAIRRRFPNARIAMMTRPATQALVDGHPDVDEVIPYFYEKKGRHSGVVGNWRFIREIGKRRFDAVFIFHPGHRAHLVSLAAGIPYRVGLGAERSSFVLTQKVPDRRHAGAKHESEYALDVVRAFGVNTSAAPPPSITVHADEEKGVAGLLAAAGAQPSEKMVVMHTGASCASKRWPIENFICLGKEILHTFDGRLVLVGGVEETSASSRIKRELGPRVVDLVGKLSLRETAAVLKLAGTLVSNDSGPVHLAAAVGAHTVSLFGRNQAGLSQLRWRALGEGHWRIQKDVGCVVCLAHRCPIDFECLRAIQVKEVHALVAQAMAAGSAQKAAL